MIQCPHCKAEMQIRIVEEVFRNHTGIKMTPEEFERWKAVEHERKARDNHHSKDRILACSKCTCAIRYIGDEQLARLS